MMTDAMALFAMYAAKLAEAKKETRIPEPEFKPFRLPKAEAAAVRAEALTPANTAREPRTLAELGVPGTLARDLETALKLAGLTKRDGVTKVTFRTADGTRYAVKTTVEAAPAGDVAA
jgi:hypothetical protein